jgi:hypothetical protein
MDLVYICRVGENEELRYSIRSAVKNLPHDKIWVVGGKPDWYTGNFINVPNNTLNKFENILECMRIITNIEEISDDFILMNDDFFFIKAIDKMPVYHGGFLKDKIDRYVELRAGKYASLLVKTYKDLIRQGIKNPLDYDIHVPMPMNKQKLKESLTKAYFPRSGYGNIHNIGGTLIKDVKAYFVRSPLYSNTYDYKQNDISFVSTEDSSFDYVYKAILKEMFLSSSPYEAI